MGLMSRFKNILTRNPTQNVTGFKLISEHGEYFSDWNGNIFHSDIVRSAVRPFVKSIGKLVAKHIRESKDGSKLKINPDDYIRMLLEEPNPLMTGQVLLEKVAWQYKLNKNAFIVIHRDENGLPYQLYPVPATSVEVDETRDGVFWFKFRFKTGKELNVKQTDVIHLVDDFYEGEVFGSSVNQALLPLMQVVNASDTSIISAVKDSKVIRWLMSFASQMRPEDMKLRVEEFANTYLKTTGDGVGVAATDGKYTLTQVKQDSFVPQNDNIASIYKRVLAMFNTNEKIIHSNYSEDEWNAYYESEIEPFVTQLSKAFTRSLFTRKDRLRGNSIIFEASSLQYASMKTKLNLLHMVDRGAMTPNEWRRIMNMGPIEGGDKAIRRLDTAVVEEGGEKDEEET